MNELIAHAAIHDPLTDLPNQDCCSWTASRLAL